MSEYGGGNTAPMHEKPFRNDYEHGGVPGDDDFADVPGGDSKGNYGYIKDKLCA